MIHISIGHKVQRLITADGQEHIVFSAFARRHVGAVPLREWVCKTQEDVQVSLQRWIFRRRLDLPPELRAAISIFLRDYSTRQDISFDCYAFANLVRSIDPHQREHLLAFWDITPQIAEPAVGDVLFALSLGRHHFHHAAIYLGFGLCISVLGAGGDLEITPLARLREDFGADEVMIATPR